MCFSVLSSSRSKTINNNPATYTSSNIYYLVNVQLRNNGIGRAQKPSNFSLVLTDTHGHTYSIDLKMMKTLKIDPEWDIQILPGSSESKTYIFKIPTNVNIKGLIISEGAAPPFIIGDENSFLYKKTILKL